MPSRLGRAGGATCLALALSLGTAHAEPGQGKKTGQEEPIAQDACERVKADFEAGGKFFNDGEFEQAIAALERVKAACPSPLLDYNLARAYEGLGDLEAAIAAYRRYLDASPTADDRGGVQKRIATLEQQLARRSAPPPSPAETPTPIPWIIGGVGLAAMGAGLGVGVVAKSHEDDAHDAADHQSSTQALSTAEDLAAASNALLVIGGLMLVAGTSWGVVDLLSLGGDEEPATSNLSLRVGLGQVSLAGRF